MRFTKHYSVDEARALLPRVQDWVEQLIRLKDRVAEIEEAWSPPRRQGADLGGPAVHRWLESLVSIREVLAEFETREIQLKDLGRGLVDFPSIREGREIFLCWENGEEDILFWHDLESGYAGRERL